MTYYFVSAMCIIHWFQDLKLMWVVKEKGLLNSCFAVQKWWFQLWPFSVLYHMADHVPIKKWTRWQHILFHTTFSNSYANNAAKPSFMTPHSAFAVLQLLCIYPAVAASCPCFFVSFGKFLVLGCGAQNMNHSPWCCMLFLHCCSSQ